MAVFAFASASGSPGVTTTVLALALAWPRPVVVVEADPTAGSAILAGYFRGVVEPAGGLVELMVAHRQGRLADRLPAALLAVPESAVKVLLGVLTQAQVAGLAPIWPSLLAALRELDDSGVDVLVDAGRLGLVGSPDPLLFGAEALVLVTGSSLRSVAAARTWTTVIAERRPSAVGLVVVGPDRPYGTKEISEVLGLPVIGRVAWEPRTAAVFSDGEQPPRHLERSAFQRTARATGEGVRDFTDAARRALPRALGTGVV